MEREKAEVKLNYVTGDLSQHIIAFNRQWHAMSSKFALWSWALLCVIMTVVNCRRLSPAYSRNWTWLENSFVDMWWDSHYTFLCPTQYVSMILQLIDFELRSFSLSATYFVEVEELLGTTWNPPHHRDQSRQMPKLSRHKTFSEIYGKEKIWW